MSYKTTRTTLVLALHSEVARGIPNLMSAIRDVEAAMFDLEFTPRASVELIYAHFDEALSSQVLTEFRFIPGIGSVRDNKTCSGFCMLCGKGDEAVLEGRSDKLRYEFRLTNVHTGECVWCGASCIINHALKVEGAGTSEEARKVLMNQLAVHKKRWQREEWRATNPDHEAILTLVSRAAQARTALLMPGPFAADMLGLNAPYWKLIELRKSVEAVARQYAKTGALGPKRESVWREVEACITAVTPLIPDLREIEVTRSPEERIAAVMKLKRLLADETSKKETDK